MFPQNLDVNYLPLDVDNVDRTGGGMDATTQKLSCDSCSISPVSSRTCRFFLRSSPDDRRVSMGHKPHYHHTTMPELQNHLTYYGSSMARSSKLGTSSVSKRMANGI